MDVVQPCVVVVVVNSVSWEVPDLAICMSRAKLKIRRIQLLASLECFELRVLFVVLLKLVGVVGCSRRARRKSARCR
jgi:hypothetical protein